MALKIDTDAANEILRKLNECIGDLQGQMHALSEEVDNITASEWSGDAAQQYKRLFHEAIYIQNDEMLDKISEEFAHMIRVNQNVAKMEDTVSSVIEKAVGFLTK